MKRFVSYGTVKSFVLWNLANLAAYAAVELASGKITAPRARLLTVGKFGGFTVGADNTIVLGPPLRFNPPTSVSSTSGHIAE